MLHMNPFDTEILLFLIAADLQKCNDKSNNMKIKIIKRLRIYLIKITKLLHFAINL